MAEQIQTFTKKSTISNNDDSNNLYSFYLKNMIDLIKYPVLTEKTSVILTKNRQYTFDVDKRLTKTQIKNLFEKLFQINVISVNTHIPPRKTVRVGLAKGYRPSYKRAIITLKENQTLNYNLNFNKN